MYWEIESDGFTYKTSELGEYFEISTSAVTNSVKKNCVAVSKSVLCSTCYKPSSFTSRNEFLNFNKTRDWTCTACLLIERERREESERILREALEDSKRTLLIESYEYRSQLIVQLEMLSFRQAIFLLAVVRFTAKESLSTLNSYQSNKVDSLSPDMDFDLDIYRELYDMNVICLSPTTDHNYININEDGGFSFYMHNVEYAFPRFEGFDSTRDFFKALESKLTSLEYIYAVYDDVAALCKDISVLECTSYLKFVLAEHNLDFTPGEKTLLLFEKVLEKFSVAQVYAFIWRAGKDAAAFYARGGVTKKHAANTVIGNVQRQFDAAVADNWDVKLYKRNYNRPQSIVSQILFNVSLQTNDGGFKQLLSSIV